MTKRERAQVVELLLCAADAAVRAFKLADAGYALGHADGIHPCTPAYALAMDAMNALYDERVKARRRIEGPRVDRWCHLEAARRVHLHEWPTEGGE